MRHDLTAADVPGRVLLVRVTRTYNPGMSPIQIYDIARWAWKRISLQQARQCQYVFAVASDSKGKGSVVGVFCPTKWDLATNIQQPKGKPTNEIQSDIAESRRAFEGTVAPSPVWNKYVGWPVSDDFCNGRNHPVPYGYLV